MYLLISEQFKSYGASFNLQIKLFFKYILKFQEQKEN